MELLWGPDIKTQAVHMIDDAHSECDLDIYELSDPDILRALIAAKQRGVTVRIVLDATEQHSQDVGEPDLQHAGVEVRTLSIPSGISHLKMLIADGQVLIGGMNFGTSSWLNNDASVWLAQD